MKRFTKFLNKAKGFVHWLMHLCRLLTFIVKHNLNSDGFEVDSNLEILSFHVPGFSLNVDAMWHTEHGLRPYSHYEWTHFLLECDISLFGLHLTTSALRRDNTLRLNADLWHENF